MGMVDVERWEGKEEKGEENKEDLIILY